MISSPQAINVRSLIAIYIEVITPQWWHQGDKGLDECYMLSASSP